MYINIYMNRIFSSHTLTIVVDWGGGSSRRFRRERRKRELGDARNLAGVSSFRSRRSRHAYPISPLESSYVCQRGPPTPRDLASDRFASERTGAPCRAGTTRDAHAMSLTSRPTVPAGPKYHRRPETGAAVVAKDPGPYIRREPALAAASLDRGKLRSKRSFDSRLKLVSSPLLTVCY